MKPWYHFPRGGTKVMREHWWLTDVVMLIFLLRVGGVGGPIEGVGGPWGCGEPPMLGSRGPVCAGASARACAKQHVDGMELVRGTLLARAAEALAMDQGDV